MNKILIVLLIFCSFSMQGIAGDSQMEVSADEFFAALRIFRKEPGGNKGKSALSTMATFAEQSPDVLVEIDQKYFPYESGTISSDAQIRFLGAFVAGNVEYQLLYGVKGNRPVEGAKLMLETYVLLRKKNAVARIEGFEKWKDLVRKNQLRFPDST